MWCRSCTDNYDAYVMVSSRKNAPTSNVHVVVVTQITTTTIQTVARATTTHYVMLSLHGQPRQNAPMSTVHTTKSYSRHDDSSTADTDVIGAVINGVCGDVTVASGAPAAVMSGVVIFIVASQVAGCWCTCLVHWFSSEQSERGRLICVYCRLHSYDYNSQLPVAQLQSVTCHMWYHTCIVSLRRTTITALPTRRFA